MAASSGARGERQGRRGKQWGERGRHRGGLIPSSRGSAAARIVAHAGDEVPPRMCFMDEGRG
jgi:hypothetical protein